MVESLEGTSVIAVGKVQDPALAEEVLASGRVDLTALSGPCLPTLICRGNGGAGRMSQVRAWIGDHKGCLGRLHQDLEVKCSVDHTLSGVGSLQAYN